MPLQLAHRALILLALGVVAGVSVHIIQNSTCPVWEVWNVVRVAGIFGTSLVFIVFGGIICIWIRDPQILVVTAILVMTGLGFLMVKGEPCHNAVLGKIDKQ